MSEARARDILAELPLRATLGAGTVGRVGARAWAAPRFAKGRRLFERCGLGDPWDPDAPEIAIEIGDVSIAARREVAPHAKPPASAAKAAASKGTATPPWAQPRPDAAPRPSGKPAPQIGTTRPDDTAAVRRNEGTGRKVSERAAAAMRVQQPVKPLPMRPGVVGPAGAEPRAGGAGVSGAGPAGAGAGGDAGRGGPVGAQSRPGAPGAGRVEGPRSGAAGTPSGGGSSADGGDTPRPAAAGGGGRGGDPTRPGSAGARLPMAPRRAALPGGPEEMELGDPIAGWAGRPPARDRTPGGDAPLDPGGDRAASAAPNPDAPRATAASIRPDRPDPPPAPPAPGSPGASPDPGPRARPASPPSGSSPAPPGAPPRPGRGGPAGSLDDLFGLGGAAEPRVRFGGAPEEPRPKRPRVVDPASVEGGIDRRPPPPKPPVVTPRPGGPTKPPEDGS